MANKIRVIDEGLSVLCTIHTANLAKGIFVDIVGDAKVDAIANEDQVPVGFIRKSTRDADGSGTIETRFDFLVDMLCDGAVAAGEFVKMGESVGGVQTFAKFTPGADAPQLMVGRCWIGAADNATGTFLVE